MMIESRQPFGINNSAKWTFVIIFLKCMAHLQCVETKDSSIVENLKDCGGEFSGYQYVISSPNYPGPYPEKQNCIFTLRGSPLAACDQTFNLQFLDFLLPPSENCAEDYVEIGDRSLFCGRVVGIRTYSSKDNTLILRFRSGARLGDKGFKILVTTLPCSPEQIKEKNRATLQEPSGTTLGNKVSDKYFVNGNTGSQKDAETFFSRNRPLIDFPIENNRQFVRGEVPSPPKVESLDEKEENDLLKVNQQPKINEAPANHLEVPIHGIKSFRESVLSKSESATPSTVQSIEEKPSKISAYLFVPPNEIHQPNRWNLPLVQGYQGINGNLGIPAKTYGVPNAPYYPTFPSSVPGIKTGEVLENSGGWIDCQGKSNLEPDLEVATNLRGKNTGLMNNLGGSQRFGSPFYPATTYGFPASRYPPYIPNENTAITPSTNWGLPAGGYPNGNVPGVNGFQRPVYPNNFNGYENFIPSTGSSVNYYPVISNSGDIGKLPLCCNVYNSGQRFLLASPGFPSSSYSGNPFECAYSIIPYSLNICRMRFNFKFFNHGTEDISCSNGHIDIDGRRICGYKKGLNIVSIVTSAFPKIVSVRYTGYPRTKFNGFLIQVIQEPCPNSYGYLSRSKKDVGNSSSANGSSFPKINIGKGNTTAAQRTKRDLGYNYPKPNFGLVEEPALGQSWNSENSPRSHPWAHEGVSANLLSPLFSCQAFSFLDWIIAAKEVYLRNSRCIGTNALSGNHFTDPFVPGNSGSGGWNNPCFNCEDINVVEGIISSPQHPTNYPDNVKKCFRFNKAPDSCLLELVIFDFDLENSIGCTKDYVTFSGNDKRYCGSSLAGRRTVFDISRGQSLNMCFVTDSFGSGRGFSAGFSQIPCQGLVNR